MQQISRTWRTAEPLPAHQLQALARAATSPWIPRLLAAVFFMPPEIAFKIGAILLLPYRVLLLALLGPALARFMRERKFNGFDGALCTYAVLALASMIYNHGADGIVSGGLAALETTGAYFVARAYFDEKQFDQFVRAWIVLALVLLPVLVLESFLHRDIVHQLALSVMGNPGAHAPVDDLRSSRFGLYRVSGPFAHAILCGVAYTAFMSWIAMMQRGVWRILIMGALFVGLLLTVSTDPILTFAIEIAAVLTLYRRGAKSWRSPVGTILLWGVPIYGVLEAFSNRPLFVVFATRLALNPWTGYYRTLIWQFGGRSVWEHPILGIGYHDWVRPIWMVAPSVDSYWLVIAMRHGLIALTLFAGACLLLLTRMITVYGERAWRVPKFRKAGAIWISVFVALIVSGITVDYWGSMAILLPLLLGYGVNLLATQASFAPHFRGADALQAASRLVPMNTRSPRVRP